MIADLKPYPKYKDSGLPWLGKIPAHWEVRRNGRLFGQRQETGYPDLPILEVSIRSGVRVRDMENGARKQQMDDRAKYKRAVRGDIAYNMMRMWQGAVGIAPTDGLVSPAYVVARPFAETDAAYYAYLFRTAAYMREIDVFSRGIVPDRNRLYWESFKQMPSAFPPLDEQRLIARFLDWHRSRTTAVIRAKQKLVELLNEGFRSSIDRVVRQGLKPLDQHSRVIAKGLEQIPAHWNICRLGSLTTQITSGSRGWSNYAADHGPLFIRIGNLTRSTLDLDLSSTVRLRLPSSSVAEARRTRVFPGDVLLSITAFIGSVAVAPDDIKEAYVNQHVARCRIENKNVNPRWVGYVLLSTVGQAHGSNCMYGGTKQGLSLDDVKNYPILLPPKPEQDELVKVLDELSAKAKICQTALHGLITEVRELKARVTHDVVTGKLDVRTFANSLPDLGILTDDADQDSSEGDVESELLEEAI